MKSRWEPGFPPDTDTDKWDVYFTIVGVVWHRRRIQGGWSCLGGGKDYGDLWAWLIADDLSDQQDGVVWGESPQPTLWAELPPDCPKT